MVSDQHRRQYVTRSADGCFSAGEVEASASLAAVDYADANARKA